VIRCVAEMDKHLVTAEKVGIPQRAVQLPRLAQGRTAAVVAAAVPAVGSTSVRWRTKKTRRKIILLSKKPTQGGQDVPGGWGFRFRMTRSLSCPPPVGNGNVVEERRSRDLRCMQWMCGLYVAVESNTCARVRLSCRARSDAPKEKEDVEVFSKNGLFSHTRTHASICAR
jgi:hypothetical protein